MSSLQRIPLHEAIVLQFAREHFTKRHGIPTLDQAVLQLEGLLDVSEIRTAVERLIRRGFVDAAFYAGQAKITTRIDGETFAQGLPALGDLERRLTETRSQAKQPLETLRKQAKTLRLDALARDIQRGIDSAEHDPEDAITAASTILETTCIAILEGLSVPLPPKRTLKFLFRAVEDNLHNLDGPAAASDVEVQDDLKRIRTGLRSVVDGVAALRSHVGDAHGSSDETPRMDPTIARLTLHASSTAATYVLERWMQHSTSPAPTG